jgi:hypothetical protein
VDTGALGLAFPQLTCSKNEVGTMTVKVKFDASVAAGAGTISGSLADPDEEAEIEIEVLPPPAAVTLVADPPAIECNGVNTTKVTAKVVTEDGRNVANGNDVHWAVDVLGTANPLVGDTTDGAASTVITPLATAGTGVPVVASVGEPTRFPRQSDDTVDLESTEPNPDFIQASVVVQCLQGAGAPAGQPGGQPAGGGTTPTGTIQGPDTGSGGDFAGRGALSVWPAVMLLVGAMGLTGARFALRRR